EPVDPRQETALIPAPDLLHDFLNRTVDAVARGALATAKWLAGDRRRKSAVSTLPLSERWLRALVSDDPTLKGGAGELEAFVADAQAWLTQLTPAAQRAPFRACFQLAEPEDNGRDWHIGFYLQANDDKSLLVPAHRVWQERSSTLTFLKRRFENPQERL